MRKIALILVGIILFSSCKTKHGTTKTHTNTRKNRAYKVKPVKQKVKHLVYKKSIIDELYKDVSGLNPKIISYIKKYNQLAINEMQIYKIPASITLAQGLLESSYGQSNLTRKSKNHFGIKCHKWKGKRVYHDDDAKGECFRKYDKDARSYRDHSLFLANKKRYAKLFTYAPNNYKSWAKGLRKAGYATDIHYPKKLISLIEKYKLYVFDNYVLGEDYKDVIESQEEIKTYHIVEEGETLYSISGKYYVSVTDIKKYNNLSVDTISVGQKLILKDKSKQGCKEHIVVKGDTLYTLSKKYQISIEKIKKTNNLLTNSLFIGQRLVVK